MKNLKFYIIILIIISLFVEVISFIVIDIKKESLSVNFIKERKIEQEEIKEYTKFLPYVRTEAYYKKNKHLISDNKSYLYNLNKEFNEKNNENILIQGDSWAARLNNFSEHKYLSEYANKFNLGIINSGMGSYSISAMTVQLDIFENKLNIRPSIIIAIIDQSDLGDELYKYKKIDKEKFPQNLARLYRNFQINSLNDFAKFNLSTYKLVNYYYNYFNFYKITHDYNNFQTLNFIFKVFKSKSSGIPLVLYPLKSGINDKEKDIFLNRILKYINQAFENKNLKKIFFITHPHEKHFQKNNNYILNVSSLIDEAINKSNFKKNILHIDFNKNKLINNESFEKGDEFSHITEKAYLDYFIPTILNKIEINKD